MKKINYEKASEFLLLAGLLVLSLFVLWPLYKELLFAVVLTIIFYPLYSKIQSKIKIKWISSLIIIAIIVALTLFPIYLITRAMTFELFSFFNSFKDAEINPIITFVEQLPFSETIFYELENIKALIFSKASQFFLALPGILLRYVVILGVTFFLLSDGVSATKKVLDLKIIKDTHANFLVKETVKTTYGIVYGQILVGLVQGFSGGIGIFIGALIFGIPGSSPLIWGTLMAICSLVPVFGTGLIWLPLSLIKIANGVLTESNSMIFYGIFILLWGALVVANIDHFVRAYFVSSKTRIHPMVIFVGVIGGLFTFGFVGIFIGPIILGLTISTIKFMRNMA
ncbi:MAG TPA: AI-2E family transporter [Candidatus Woesearchaeota archaeon]|nr:AI-2E family transporter [Candidatus Woesearchaeota archaeon]